jgi:3-(3-hydroxy-phenyl)propionate hydroxylase
MTRKLPQHIDVAIIGAGPTGLTAANLLASYGISALVFERNEKPMDIPRAIVLDDEGARILQVFGGDTAYLDQTITGIGGKYYDDAGTCFSEVGTGPKTYGFEKKHYINQPALEQALHGLLDATPLAEVLFSHDVTGLQQSADRVRLTLATPSGEAEVQARYVLACDGGKSPTRDRLGIAMQGSTYRQDWVVIDTLNDPDQSRFSKFYCSNSRPHVSIPAPGGGRRYEFMLLPGESHEAALAGGFVDALMKPFRKLEKCDLIRKTIYTFHARIADRFRQDRVLILGDAAHLTPPFAGQGMNAGLRDAMNVAWKLAVVLKGGASAILDSYEVERRDPAWAMIQLAVAMGDIVMPIEPQQLAFREHLVKALQPFPQVQDYFMQMKFKPKPRYTAGLFVGLDAQPFEASLVGEMIPQPDLQTADGVVKLDAALGAGFALIAQDQAGERALAAVAIDAFCGLPLACWRLAWGKDAPVSATGLPRATLADDGIARPLRTHRDQVLLIRPDRYCAGAFFPDDLAKGLADYQRHLTKANSVSRNT